MKTSLLTSLRKSFHPGEYPRQFWLLFWGMLISATGMSMIWPFLLIYASEKLQLPLATAAGLMTVSSVMGLFASFIGGPVVDRLGRKWVMVISLLLNGLGYFILSQAQTLAGFTLAMAVTGTFNPLYRVGADAMLADLVAPERRVDAYSLMRMSNNIGVAMGPAIGGVLASVSYAIAFFFAMGGLALYGVLVAFFARETLPAQGQSSSEQPREVLGGYGKVLSDGNYLHFIGSYVLVSMCMALVWVLLSVYAKENYGIPESQYGLVPTTNALMVIFFQLAVTRLTRRHRPTYVMAFGTLFYAASNLCVAFAGGFWTIWLGMVVMTVGELMLVPTASTYAANMAPANMRGRYMSLFGLTWGVASGISPLLGGLLSDHYGPRTPWFGGTLVGLAAVVSFLLLKRSDPAPASQLEVE